MRIAICAVVLALGLVALSVFVFRQPHVGIWTDDASLVLTLPIESYDLFDIGVVDFDENSRLDIFTVNHSARQSLLRNEGDLTFVESLAALGLSQDRNFPILEDSQQRPDRDRPGLYFFRQDRWLHISAKQIDAQEPVIGTISVPWPLDVKKSDGVTRIANANLSSGEPSLLEFSMTGNQEIVLTGMEDISELPHHVVLSPDTDLDKVYVGNGRISPESREFTLTWRDRHGHAWADFNGDGLMDVFIARGGVKGQLDSIPIAINDEFFLGTGASFVDRTMEAGLVKGNCPARQTSAVDFDLDGDLDIFVACGRGDDPSFPNRLYMQLDDGQFVDVAGDAGLAHGTASVYTWVDSDGDRDPDLLAVEERFLFHYVNEYGRFRRVMLADDSAGTDPYSLSPADFDNDGDIDAFAVYRSGSFVILNDAGQYRIEPAESFGLPVSGRTAAWIDINHDGLVDLHVLPGGAYYQDSDTRFHHSGELALNGSPTSLVDARATWFDIDNDGDRDALIALKTGPTIYQRVMRRLFKKEPMLGDHWLTQVVVTPGTPRSHWLQVELEGEARNRQAIGALVKVVTPDSVQTQRVGAAEGSLHGQGHYRLYFGLGDRAHIDEVIVDWADGTEKRVADPAPNQLLRIDKSP